MQISCILEFVFLLLSYAVIEFMKLFTSGITMILYGKFKGSFKRNNENICNNISKMIYMDTNRTNHVIFMGIDSVTSLYTALGCFFFFRFTNFIL